MNFTPFGGQFAGSIPASAVHQFTTAKFAQNITAATNGAQMGQVVGVLSSGEGGVHYLRPVEGGAGFQALPHQPQQHQLITLPITMPGAKPGDPQQTVQIQVMNPNVSTLTTQTSMQQPKYQMAQMQIPIQTFQQGELGTTVLTLAYAQQDGSEGVQILGNAGLTDGIQVVAALQPQDMQILTSHLQSAEQQSSAGKSQSVDNSVNVTNSQGQQIQMGTLLQAQQLVSMADDGSGKKTLTFNNNNNNNTFRIKQEVISNDDTVTIESGPQWTIAAQGAEIAEYLSRIPGSAPLPVSLQQFLRFNNDSNSIKREAGSDGNSGGASADDKDGLVDEMILPDVMENNIQVEMPALKTKKKKKYKKKPPKPKKPKPGQVVIATSLDGTTLYCCPECHMAYPDKDLLEQHLVGHKIERRYICGICGAGLKRREHLERHKLGHNPDRPFVCPVCQKGFKRKEHLNLHSVIHSGEKTEVCQECGKGFYRKDHLRKHARSHATRRAREELAAAQQQTQQQDQQLSQQQVVSTPTSTSNTQIRMQTGGNNSQLSEITIHVPTSNMAVPVQISVPHHIVAMANSMNPGTQQSITLKPEDEQALIQHMASANRGCNETQS